MCKSIFEATTVHRQGSVSTAVELYLGVSARQETGMVQLHIAFETPTRQ